jgi:hypothetical protein
MSTFRLRRRMAAIAGGADPARRLLSGRVARPWVAWPNALASRLAAWGTAWVETCADYHRAAFLYEELRHRSDAALRARRLSRAALAWEVAQTCDRTNGAR